MKKIFFLFFVTCFFCNAQKAFDPALLNGSFVLEGTKMEGKEFQKSSARTVITFFADSVYQEQYFRSLDSKSLLSKTGGKWRLVKNNSLLELYSRHSVPYVIGVQWANYTNGIIALNDSVLVLRGEEGTTDILMFFKKTKTENRFADNYVKDSFTPVTYRLLTPTETHTVVIDFNDYENIKEKYCFVNTLDSTRTKWIKRWADLTFEFELPLNDSTMQSKTVLTRGGVIRLEGTNLEFGVKNEDINVSMRSGYTSSISNDYESWSSNGGYDKGVVKAGKVDLLKYNKVHYSREPVFTIGAAGALTMISLTNAIFVAPLVSINYKTGAFNSKRYFTFLKGSGIILPVAITFALIRKERDYEISQDRSEKGKDIWYIRQKDL